MLSLTLPTYLLECIIAKISEHRQIEIDSNNRDNNHIKIQITETKTENQVIAAAPEAAPLVIKCQVCQVLMDVFVAKTSPNFVKYSFCNEDASILKAQPGQEYITSCSCNSLSLAAKQSMDICLPIQDCIEVTREQHVCCILCANPFRFYPMDKNDHCSHCTGYSKFVYVIVELCFSIILISSSALLMIAPIILASYVCQYASVFLNRLKNWNDHSQ